MESSDITTPSNLCLYDEWLNSTSYKMSHSLAQNNGLKVSCHYLDRSKIFQKLGDHEAAANDIITGRRAYAVEAVAKYHGDMPKASAEALVDSLHAYPTTAERARHFDPSITNKIIESSKAIDTARDDWTKADALSWRARNYARMGEKDLAADDMDRAGKLLKSMPPRAPKCSSDVTTDANGTGLMGTLRRVLGTS